MPVSLVGFRESRAQLACGAGATLGMWSLFHSQVNHDFPRLRAALGALPGNDAVTPTAGLICTAFILGVLLEGVWVGSGRLRLRFAPFRSHNAQQLKQSLDNWQSKGENQLSEDALDRVRQNASRLELGLIAHGGTEAAIRVYDELRRLRSHANLLDALSVGILIGGLLASVAEWGLSFRLLAAGTVVLATSVGLWWRAENSWRLWWRNLTFASESQPQALDEILLRSLKLGAVVKDSDGGSTNTQSVKRNVRPSPSTIATTAPLREPPLTG